MVRYSKLRVWWEESLGMRRVLWGVFWLLLRVLRISVSFLTSTRISQSTRPRPELADLRHLAPPATVHIRHISLNTTITTVPRPSPAIASTTTQLCGNQTTPSCPAPIITTCTVTETWHSTHYAETATWYSFVANSTVTCTETVRYGIKYIPETSIY